MFKQTPHFEAPPAHKRTVQAACGQLGPELVVSVWQNASGQNLSPQDITFNAMSTAASTPVEKSFYFYLKTLWCTKDLPPKAHVSKSKWKQNYAAAEPTCASPLVPVAQCTTL